ncbi:hypothetical protein TNCV_3382231 [Trichonephila clavipes]|nr:hypothetical protein TNCV_3382231 [Trichonephila clavipes]
MCPNFLSKRDFQVPEVVTNDRGTQFKSELYQFLTNFLGSVRMRTMSYHPVSYGMVERFPSPLKHSIKCHGTERWTTTLPVALQKQTVWFDRLKPAFLLNDELQADHVVPATTIPDRLQYMTRLGRFRTDSPVRAALSNMILAFQILVRTEAAAGRVWIPSSALAGLDTPVTLVKVQFSDIVKRSGLLLNYRL